MKLPLVKFACDVLITIIGLLIAGAILHALLGVRFFCS